MAEVDQMEQFAQVMIGCLRLLPPSVPLEVRRTAIETVLTGYVRAAVQALPPASVAAMLRELADSIENG